ncbi:caspase, EACC1-associated type [Actinomadura fibrosa]|uniref:Caspase family protein n=1 Tax=Actinomadura fibrosa TaxID=111802 RepID=A0ABW2XW15_9ACTN|nr:caspase family protein [Actinomadura fibrosa]
MSVLPDPSASRAVLIGTSRYTHPSLGDLPAVTANLAALAGLLRSPEVWGLPASHCVVVADPATAAEMMGPIVRAAAEATDTLLVYYAGHGLVARLASELHLTLTGSERANASYSAVSYGVLREELAGARAERQVVILDCCYSGQALGRMGGGDSAETVADEAVIEGTCLIAAASENRTAVSVPGERYTAFTGELLGVLGRGVPGKGPYLDLDTLAGEIRASLRAKQRPLPQTRVRNTASRLAFRNRAFDGRHQRWRELLAEAERTARTLPDPEDGFGWIIAGLAAHDPAEAERLARGIADGEHREFRLAQLAEALAGSDPADAERIARSLADPEARNRSLHDIVRAMAGRDPAAAERLARTITFPAHWAAALHGVARALAERGDGRARELLDEIERYVRTIDDPRERASGLQAAAVTAVGQDPRRALDLLVEAERLLAGASDGGLQDDLYGRYLKVKDALTLIAARAPAEAESFVRTMLADAEPDDRAFLLGSIAGDLAEHAPVAAERIVSTGDDPASRPSIGVEFVKALARQDPAAAERVVRALTDPGDRGPLLPLIAENLVARDPGRAAGLLAEAERLARATSAGRAAQLPAVAGVLARLHPDRARDLLVEAEGLARAGPTTETTAASAAGDPFRRSPETLAAVWRITSLMRVAAGWARLDPAHAADLLEEASRLDGAQQHFGYVMLTEVIRTLAERDPSAAVRAARLHTSGYDRAEAFRDIVAVLAATDPAEAERLARGISDVAERSRALQTVVEVLIDRDPDLAGRVARGIPDPHTKIHMLGCLAASLP